MSWDKSLIIKDSEDLDNDWIWIKVRFRLEREGCQYVNKDSEAFEPFIIENNLWDVPLQDNHYTWFGPYNRKSRIDRALVNYWWPSYNSRRLLEDNKKHFDHIPLLFQIKHVDWGHIPFKAFNF